jgi:hypothetical protein
MTPPDDGSHLVFSNDTACHSRVSFYPPHSTSVYLVYGITSRKWGFNDTSQMTLCGQIIPTLPFQEGYLQKKMIP